MQLPNIRQWWNKNGSFEHASIRRPELFLDVSRFHLKNLARPSSFAFILIIRKVDWVVKPDFYVTLLLFGIVIVWLFISIGWHHDIYHGGQWWPQLYWAPIMILAGIRLVHLDRRNNDGQDRMTRLFAEGIVFPFQFTMIKKIKVHLLSFFIILLYF